jgi:iodotyrosine deiodinase
MAHRPVPLAYRRPTQEEQLERSRSFLDLMRTRRSVRQFSPEPVPWELVENAVETAGTAPSGAHQQPWTFVAVSDPRVKRALREAAEEEERRGYEGRMGAEWLRALEPIGTDWRKPHIEDAPYVVVVFEHAYGLADGRKVKHYYVRESVGIAVGLLLASLHAAGLATLTHTPSPMRFLARILERPPNERPYLLIPVGFPAEGATVPDLVRKPLESILVRR